MTDEELEAIEARANAATPGPWHYVDDQPRYKGVIRPVGQGWREVGVCAFGNEWLLTEDERFITSARTDVPALVAEVRRLRAEVDDRSFVNGWNNACDRFGRPDEKMPER